MAEPQGEDRGGSCTAGSRVGIRSSRRPAGLPRGWPGVDVGQPAERGIGRVGLAMSIVQRQRGVLQWTLQLNVPRQYTSLGCLRACDAFVAGSVCMLGEVVSAGGWRESQRSCPVTDLGVGIMRFICKKEREICGTDSRRAGRAASR